MVIAPPRATYAAAVEALAGSVVRALTGQAEGFRLAEQLTISDGGRAGLAAVRVLGPDALAPFVLGAHQFSDVDAEVVADSIRTFPLADPEHPDAPVRMLRDWATGEILCRLGVDAAVCCYPLGARISHDQGWVAWAAVLAQLAGLVFPGLDCPVHADARRHRLDLARAVTRAVLRRDYLTAARLTRWLALSGDTPTHPVFAVEPLLRHLELVAEPDARLRLDILMARHHQPRP